MINTCQIMHSIPWYCLLTSYVYVFRGVYRNLKRGCETWPRAKRAKIFFRTPRKTASHPSPYRAVAKRISKSEKKGLFVKTKEKKNRTKHCPCPLLVIYDKMSSWGHMVRVRRAARSTPLAESLDSHSTSFIQAFFFNFTLSLIFSEQYWTWIPPSQIRA